MDERDIMMLAGQYKDKEDLTPDQRAIMESLFGKYYRQAGNAMMYLKTDNGQKILGTALIIVLLTIATKKRKKQ